VLLKEISKTVSTQTNESGTQTDVIFHQIEQKKLRDIFINWPYEGETVFVKGSWDDWTFLHRLISVEDLPFEGTRGTLAAQL
jgi:hypothetical protein